MQRVSSRHRESLAELYESRSDAAREGAEQITDANERLIDCEKNVGEVARENGEE